MIKVNFTKLDKNATVPKYGTPFAAGADLYALPKGDITLNPGESAFFHTGIAVEIPEGYVGLVYARSGIATKRGLAPSNKVGVIDSDYRGEIMVSLHNHSNEPQIIESGERIAQLVITPYITADFCEVDSLSDTERSTSGFGSTGKK